MSMVCQFWDCGWCYAPDHILTNSPKGTGECPSMRSCPQSVNIDDAMHNEPVQLELKLEEVSKEDSIKMLLDYEDKLPKF